MLDTTGEAQGDADQETHQLLKHYQRRVRRRDSEQGKLQQVRTCIVPTLTDDPRRESDALPGYAVVYNIAGGQVIEDIDDFNRLSLMLTALKPQDEQLGIANEGFGSYDEDVNQCHADYTDVRRSFHLDDALIAGSITEARQVLFKPMLGILKQDKHIPLRYCPLQIELELVSDPAEAVYVGSKTAAHTCILYVLYV